MRDSVDCFEWVTDTASRRGAKGEWMMGKENDITRELSIKITCTLLHPLDRENSAVLSTNFGENCQLGSEITSFRRRDRSYFLCPVMLDESCRLRRFFFHAQKIFIELRSDELLIIPAHCPLFFPNLFCTWLNYVKMKWFLLSHMFVVLFQLIL